MRTIIVVIIFFFTSFLTLWAIPVSNLEEAKNATVYIRQQSVAGKSLYSGTGFFINDFGTIVTNFHVIKPNFNIRIYVYNKSTKTFYSESKSIISFSNISILNYDKRKDLAILQINDDSFFDSNRENNYFKISSSNSLKELTETIAIGFPRGGQNWTVTDGKISSISSNRIQITTPINPGNSGGPLIFSSDFSLIGINVAKVTENDNTAFSIPVQHLLELLSNRPKFNTDVINMYLCTTHTNMKNDFVKYLSKYTNEFFIMPKNISIKENKSDNGIISFSLGISQNFNISVYFDTYKRNDFVNVFNRWDQEELDELLDKDKKRYKQVYNVEDSTFSARLNHFSARIFSLESDFYTSYWAFNTYKNNTYFIYSKTNDYNDKFQFFSKGNPGYNHFFHYIRGLLGCFRENLDFDNFIIPYEKFSEFDNNRENNGNNDVLEVDSNKICDIEQIFAGNYDTDIELRKSNKKNRIKLSLSLNRKSLVQLELFDKYNEPILTLYNNYLESGIYILESNLGNHLKHVYSNYVLKYIVNGNVIKIIEIKM